MTETVTDAGVATVPRPRVVVAAVVPRRRWKALQVVEDVVTAGGSALLLTADGGDAPDDVAAGVERIDLSRTERRLGLHPLLSRSPVRMLRRALGRPVAGPSRPWAAWTASKPYRVLRPWLMWRALRRHLDAVAVEQVDHVVIVGQESWPIAWHLARRNPAITVGWDVPDEVYDRYGRRPAPRPEPDPTDLD